MALCYRTARHLAALAGGMEAAMIVTELGHRNGYPIPVSATLGVVIGAALAWGVVAFLPSQLHTHIAQWAPLHPRGDEAV